MWWLKSAKQGLTVRPIAVYLFQPTVAFSSSPRRSVKLNFEEYSSKKVRKDLLPVVIAHGMLGSLVNW